MAYTSAFKVMRGLKECERTDSVELGNFSGTSQPVILKPSASGQGQKVDRLCEGDS